MYSFLFASPEALITSRWREAIDCHKVAERIVAVVIDEAHCVSKWLVLVCVCVFFCVCVCWHQCA